MSAWKLKSFWNVLSSAAGSGWSGQIEARDSKGPAGAIIFYQGRIAWAVSRRQSEDLGAFLWRLGKVSPAALQRAKACFHAEGGKRKLGAILEQDHNLERPVLRHCLRLHTQLAVDSLATLEDLTLLSNGGQMNVSDDELTFDIQDFLPSIPPSDRQF